eukprot:m.102290 g.102290  ORF g.102290 m.102290 type:complete len:210 (+) comp9075_c0_seq1:103-732(+)
MGSGRNGANKTKKNVSSGLTDVETKQRGKKTLHNFLVIIFTVYIAIGIAYITQHPEGLPSLTEERSEAKPYKSFPEFFPFYLQEHSDVQCRISHYIGTTIVTFMMVLNPSTLFALMVGFINGYLACGLFAFADNGLYEALVMLCTFFIVEYSLSKSIKGAILALLIGYAFAWVGHFMFEKNVPATFIYPSFSLISDFKMLFQAIATMEP